jgi:hypothetical protein
MDEDRHRLPDVSVTRAPETVPITNGSVAIEPYTRLGMLDVESRFIPEPTVEKYVEIVSTEDERLITSIEMLSISNKTPGDEGRGAYRQKQAELRAQKVNLVEIDLLRGGTHSTAIPLGELRQRAGRIDYHACVSIIGFVGHYLISPFTLQDRIPTIGVPLEGVLSPVALELQPLLDRAYDTGRHGETNYVKKRPEPPLTAEQQVWAESILRSKGLIK